MKLAYVEADFGRKHTFGEVQMPSNKVLQPGKGKLSHLLHSVVRRHPAGCSSFALAANIDYEKQPLLLTGQVSNETS